MSAPRLVIRLANADDLPGIQAIESLQPHGWSSTMLGDHVLAVSDNPRCSNYTLAAEFISDDDSTLATLAGYALFQQVVDELTLMNIVVAPVWRRNGVAHALLDAGLKQATNNGAKSCFLEVRASNEGAVALYSQYGFECCGRRRNYYPCDNVESGGREDAILYNLDLTSIINE